MVSFNSDLVIKNELQGIFLLGCYNNKDLPYGGKFTGILKSLEYYKEKIEVEKKCVDSRTGQNK